MTRSGEYRFERKFERKKAFMGAMVLVLLLALVLFGLGFTLKILWWIALALVVVWLVGMIRPAQGRRFYHWGHR